MKNKLFLINFLLLLFCFNLNAQNVEFKKENFPDRKKELRKAILEIEEGNKSYEIGKGMYYLDAIKHYIKANKFNPDNALLNYKIGKCYLNTIQKTNSIAFFEKALKLDPNISQEINYLLGQAHQLNYEFDKAISKYNKYKQSLSPADITSFGKVIDKKIKECDNGKRLVNDSVRVFIDNLGDVVNSAYPEYNPIINADESMMIFTSRRDNTTGGNKDPSDNKYYEDIYITYKNNNIWSSPKNPGKSLNTNYHNATMGLSPDGQKLFTYEGSNEGDIYQCNLKGDKWSKPKKLGKNINTKYHESSASFSYDGKIIYFVSDKSGGYGGNDIYMSEIDKKGKNWGKAVNLGPVINTPYNEEGVFMLPDGKTLYFSSKGHKTMGGYDIFKSVYENGKWSEPENLGYPINTTGNDVSFSITASGEHGYYSSTKKGGIGEQDIYLMTFLGHEKPLIYNSEDNMLANIAEPISETVIEPTIEIKTSQLTLLKGLILLDEKTKEPLEATIEITDNQKNEVVARFTSNSKTGKYLITLPSGKNYGITVEAKGYLFHSENFDISSSAEYHEIEKDILLKKIEVGQKVVLKNIFFDFDKASLRSESVAELNRLTKLMNDVPSLKIEVSGHTDNIGSAAYNKNLSEKRAKSVADYLTNHGIKKDRLEYVGYGFSQPIATNDTDEGRQQNRRTEFKVLSRTY